MSEDVEDLEISQFVATITGDGGRERYMRDLDDMIGADPFVLFDMRDKK